MTNQEFFDHLAPDWDATTHVVPDKIRHIVDVAGIKEGADVLDVGTGTGVMIPFMLEAMHGNGHITGVDLSEEMLKRARLKNAGCEAVEFKQFDIEAENLDRRYDNIMMYCMFPHLQNQIDTLEWLVKMNLKPGGTLVIAHPTSKECINSLHNHNGPVHSNHLIDAALFSDILAERGLNVDYTEDSRDYYIVRLRA